MFRSTAKTCAACAAGWLALAAPRTPAATRPALTPASMRNSVVKIFVTNQRYDPSYPWQKHGARAATGSAFFIGKRRLLTNAHVISDARFLEVQRDGDARRFPARVEFAGHDCDLAALTVDDPAFFEELQPLVFADDLPEINEEVVAVGFPLGGSRLSVTRGVVSRIDYGAYAHSMVDQHLVLQVDAAINPGNSGGPIVYGGRVVGLAFQGLSFAENIGYGIPLPVIHHFLDDIEDGQYNGYPELGVLFMDTRNRALRGDLTLGTNQTGVAVVRTDPFGSAHGHIQPRDVLTAIDGHTIANDGTVQLNGSVVIFQEILERKQWGDAIRLDVWRGGRMVQVDVTLTNPHDPFVFRRRYDVKPRYLVYGGLVFAPLTREHLSTVEPSLSDPAAHQLHYYAAFAKIDDLYKGKREFVVLVNRLPHPVNTYADAFMNGIVETVNGESISELGDVMQALVNSEEKFHVVEFAGNDNVLVLDAQATARASLPILSAYGVPEPFYLGPIDR